MKIPSTSIEKIALLMDFDGTLVPIASTPYAVNVSPPVKDLLDRLIMLTKGALAVVTGRKLESIDALLNMPNINIAANHGAQWRYQGKVTHEATPIEGYFKAILPTLREFAEQHNLILEDKQFSLALHFRQAPELEAQIHDLFLQLAQPYQELEIMAGKCLRELKASNINKGVISERIMQLPPFAGKTPYFFGDDITDEYGFRWVNKVGGVSVKVGDGDTDANYRVDSVDDILAFLHELAYADSTN